MIRTLTLQSKDTDFISFHDLEDDDHDAEADKEERPVPWDDLEDKHKEIKDFDRWDNGNVKRGKFFDHVHALLFVLTQQK